MSTHPVATDEQHAHERHALELSRHPTVRAAYERVKKDWLENGRPTPGPDMRARCESAFEEVMFLSLIHI